MLELSRSHYQVIVEQARTGSPKEICGLIAGVERQQRRIIKKVYPLTNVDDSAEHFAMDPREQFAAVRDVRQNDWVLFGNYHSHPSSRAIPSQEDFRLALDPGAIYLILSLKDAQNPELRGFRIHHGVAAAEPINIVEDEEANDAGGL